jgi:hypothetical protein
MSELDEVDRSELEWRTADAVAGEHRGMGSCLVLRVLGAGEQGASIAEWCAEWSEEELGGDAYGPFGLLWAVRDAANQTGLELPWDLCVNDGDLVLVLNDRDGALKLLSAMHHLPLLDHFIAQAAAS